MTEARGIIDRRQNNNSSSSSNEGRTHWRESIRNLGRKRPRKEPRPQQQQAETTELFLTKEKEEEEQLRRQREETSTLLPSMAAFDASRERQFVESLPLRAPIARDHVCSGCLKYECECDPESDQEDSEEEEELSQTCIARFLRYIRLRTDVVRDISGRIVNDQAFQTFIVVLIILNCVVIGAATFEVIEENPDASRAFRILDLSFLIVFTIELIMQFLYHGYDLFLDGWLLFDLFIVITSWTLESISVLRALKLRSFRIFRAFRLTTRIRALRRLVQAIFDVIPKITAIIVMFALVMYVFGVMCTELFGEIDYTDLFYEDKLGEYDYFSRLDKTIFTLFVMVTLDWAKVTRATMREYSWAWAIFSTFVTFSSFVLYNLIIAVVCDAVKMVQDKQDILMVENYVKDKIESRHRIINLRQKLDKMSKQQMDLLLYVKLLMEQLDDIDEETKEQYEKTLLLLGRTTGNTKEVLMNAIQQLDEIDRADGILPDGQGDDFYYYQSTNAKKKDATNETYAAEDEKTLSKDRQLKVYFRSNSERVDSLNDPPKKAAKQKSQDLVEHPENYDEDDAFMQEDRRSSSETKHFLSNEDLDGSEMFISARWNASDDSCWRDQDGVEEPSAFVKNKGTRQPCKYS